MTMISDAQETTEVYRVQDERGNWLTIPIVKTVGEQKIDEIDISNPAMRDGPAEAAGRKPTLRHGKQMVRVYKGFTMSLIPKAQLAWAMSQGFTPNPTAVAPELKFP